MAKQVIWSPLAKTDRKNILKYWESRNKSKVYPKKLNKLFSEAVSILAAYDIPRRTTDIPNVFVKLVRDYKIYFTENKETITILTIWDTRQSPDKLPIKLKK